jgi:hypothetical protein
VITLNATTKTLELKLTSAITTNQLDWHVDHVDLDLSSSLVVSDVIETDGASNSTTAVTILAAPASNHRKQTKYFTVYNKDTGAAEVTIQINTSGTVRILCKVTLQVGETLQYVA